MPFASLLLAIRKQTDRGVFGYKITRDSIYKAQQADLSVSDVTQWLVDQSGQPLPQNVLRSLDEWRAHHERIVFRTGVTLLQTENADALQALQNNGVANIGEITIFHMKMSL